MKAIVKSIGSKHSYFDYTFKAGEEFTETKDIKFAYLESEQNCFESTIAMNLMVTIGSWKNDYNIHHSP